MHYADFGAARLREIDEKIATVDKHILAGSPSEWVIYRQAVARRIALLEVRDLIVHALGRDETRLPPSR